MVNETFLHFTFPKTQVKKFNILTKYFNITQGQVFLFAQFHLKLLDVAEDAQDVVEDAPVFEEVRKPRQQIFCEQMTKSFLELFFRKSF